MPLCSAQIITTFITDFAFLYIRGNVLKIKSFNDHLPLHIYWHPLLPIGLSPNIIPKLLRCKSDNEGQLAWVKYFIPSLSI